MDINTLIPSAIIPQKDDTCSILFPSFSWFCETVLYRNTNNRLQSYGQKELSPFFRTNDFLHDTDIVIIASNFFGYIAVRMIDIKSIYQERLFLIEEGEIFSFFLKWESYFAFIYTDIDGKKYIETNLKNDTIFSYIFENNVFSVVNSLTEMIVFEKKIPIVGKKIIQSNWEIVDTYTFCVMEDPFSEEPRRFLEKCIRVLPMYEDQQWWFYLLSFERVSILELSRFIGFLGKYSCILPDIPLWIPGYITTGEAWDNIFSLPETFSTSNKIEYLDPRWDRFRKGILELTYMEYLLGEHIKLLKWWMESIGNLQNEHVLFQYKRLELTLYDAELLYPKYRSQKQILLKLLRNKIP